VDIPFAGADLGSGPARIAGNIHFFSLACLQFFRKII
jgi:hypothetical protein